MTAIVRTVAAANEKLKYVFARSVTSRSATGGGGGSFAGRLAVTTGGVAVAASCTVWGDVLSVIGSAHAAPAVSFVVDDADGSWTSS